MFRFLFSKDNPPLNCTVGSADFEEGLFVYCQSQQRVLMYGHKGVIVADLSISEAREGERGER